MNLKINEENVTKINFQGRGGKEKDILSCFKNNLKRENAILFDCKDLDTGEKYELKKQKDLQWFDPAKFFSLSKEDKDIMIIFLLIDPKGYCDMIATTRLGDFVDRSFDIKQLQDGKNYVKKYPKDQIKSGIKIRDFIKNNKEILEIAWKR